MYLNSTLKGFLIDNEIKRNGFIIILISGIKSVPGFVNRRSNVQRS